MPTKAARTARHSNIAGMASCTGATTGASALGARALRVGRPVVAPRGDPQARLAHPKGHAPRAAPLRYYYQALLLPV